MFLTRGPTGDVSKGKVITLENFQEISRHPQRQGHGRTAPASDAVPAQQFNATFDRKTLHPEGMKGVACSIAMSRPHLRRDAPGRDIRPQSHRRRIQTVSLRWSHVQLIFGSQRAMKSSQTSPSSNSWPPISMAIR